MFEKLKLNPASLQYHADRLAPWRIVITQNQYKS
jgi:hypothetical protein